MECTVLRVQRIVALARESVHTSLSDCWHPCFWYAHFSSPVCRRGIPPLARTAGRSGNTSISRPTVFPWRPPPKKLPVLLPKIVYRLPRHMNRWNANSVRLIVCILRIKLMKSGELCGHKLPETSIPGTKLILQQVDLAMQCQPQRARRQTTKKFASQYTRPLSAAKQEKQRGNRVYRVPLEQWCSLHTYPIGHRVSHAVPKVN